MRQNRSAFVLLAVLSLASAPARAAPCDPEQLRAGIQAIAKGDNAAGRMTEALTLVDKACASALPRPWRSALQSSLLFSAWERAQPLTRGLFGTDAQLAQKVCGGKGSLADGFTKPPEARRQVFRTCALAERKVLSEKEYVRAIAPEAAIVLFDWMREQQLTREEARTLARWMAGIGVEAPKDEPVAIATRGSGSDQKVWMTLPDGPLRGVAVKAEVEGDGLPVEVVEKVLQRHRGQSAFCYENERLRDAALQATLVVAFISIDPSGRVSAAEVEETTVKGDAVARCVVDRMRKWAFPIPAQDAPVKARARWTFTSPPPEVP